MRIMRQIRRTAGNICFVADFLYKTNIRALIPSKVPHVASYASCFGRVVVKSLLEGVKT